MLNLQEFMSDCGLVFVATMHIEIFALNQVCSKEIDKVIKKLRIRQNDDLFFVAVLEV